MPSDFAIHSDLLVHWTGKDIEKECATSDPKKRDTEYINRLEHILTYGLWMTDQDPPNLDGSSSCKPAACTCFTELKLSQSRHHAEKFGKLGLAFKRPFIFQRSGRPVIYYCGAAGSWTNQDKFLLGCASDLKDNRLMHFFKPMNSSHVLNYDLFSESEWRIVFDEHLLKNQLIVDPRDDHSQASQYYSSLLPEQQSKLRYLIPIHGWLAMIIYPTLSIKRIAQHPGGNIQRLLRKIATNSTPERNILPVEIDLNLCRNL